MKKIKTTTIDAMVIFGGLGLYGGIFVAVIALVGYFIIDGIFCGLYDHVILCKILSFMLKVSIPTLVIGGILSMIGNELDKKALLNSIVKTTNTYSKGKVISKNKTTKTSGDIDSGIRTNISYTTTIRLEGSESIIYFYDEKTFNECLEGEIVSIETLYHYDKDDKLVLTEHHHIGSENAI